MRGSPKTIAKIKSTARKIPDKIKILLYIISFPPAEKF